MKALPSKGGGPVTSKGKARSRRNAMKHGIRAERVLPAVESGIEFAYFREDVMRRFTPSVGDDAVAVALMDSLTMTLWRMRRVWRWEAEQIDRRNARRQAPAPVEVEILGPDAIEPEEAMPGAAAVELAMRYETHLVRTMRRTLAALRELSSFGNPMEKPETIQGNPGM